LGIEKVCGNRERELIKREAAEKITMLVSHRHKFIYTKTVKTAGTSVESYFERFCMPENEWTFTDGRSEYVSESGIIGYRGSKPPENCKWWNHMPAALIRKKIGNEIWTSYFKFCVIRNPYEKALSAFFFFRRLDNPPTHTASLNSNDLNKERADFEDWLQHSNRLPIDRDKYFIEGKFCLDDVVRYETLATDLERICARIAVPWNRSWLPTLKAGIRPLNANVETLYTENSRKIVETVYSLELEYFDYSFPRV
jgi:hypothetical protein